LINSDVARLLKQISKVSWQRSLLWQICGTCNIVLGFESKEIDWIAPFTCTKQITLKLNYKCLS
jgi:hypothetical protein